MTDRTRVALWAVVLTPLVGLLALVAYLLFFTNLAREWYVQSIRSLPFDCMVISSAPYIYKSKPGPCPLKTFEYDVVLTSDRNGFRNAIRRARDYEVAVIGDSFAQGFGVADHQTFPHLLEAAYQYRTINLGMGSYATLRELEALGAYGQNARYVIVQYCDNDAAENLESLRLDQDALRAETERSLRRRMASYREGKAVGYRKPLLDLAVMLRYRTFTTRAAWQRIVEQRPMEQEASAFAQIVARYRSLLEEKRLIVIETANWRSNSRRFKTTFDAELDKLSWLRYRVLDGTSILTAAHYFWLDEHINQRGHEALAAAVAAEIGRWERADPIIRPRD